MKKLIARAVIALCGALLCAQSVTAQEDAPMPTPVVEIFGCNFNDGNDMEDLLAVTARWNAWADRNDSTDYTAFIAVPYLYSDQLTFDALWIGGWPNGAAMGAGEALWFTEGQDLAADFDAVADCSVHAQFAEVVIHAPEGAPPENGLAAFSDCSVREGRTVPEAITALTQWSEYLADRGHDMFSAILFPLAGESSEADYMFKAVDGFQSVEAYGAFVDTYTGGGFTRADELFGRLLDCNSPRLYMLDLVRQAAPPSSPSG